MRTVLIALLWIAKFVAAIAAVGALGLGWPLIAEFGRLLAGDRYDAYLAWLARALDVPMDVLAPVFRAMEGSPRWVWLRAIIPLNVAILIWAVPSPRSADGK